MLPVALAGLALLPLAGANIPDLRYSLEDSGIEAGAANAELSVSPAEAEADLRLLEEWRARMALRNEGQPTPESEASAPASSQGDQQSPVARQAAQALNTAGSQAQSFQAEGEKAAAQVENQATQVVASLPQDPIAFASGTAQDAASEVQFIFPALAADESAEDPQSLSEGASVVKHSAMTPFLAGSILVAGAAGATFFAFWLAGSSGTVATGAAATKGTDLRRLLPFASPLFTRFEKETVLGHPRREALYALILQQPGISLQALGEATGLSRTAVLHHLRLLEMQHLVVSKRMGRSRHYYENGGRYGRDAKEAYAVLQNERSKEVAEFIRTHPGTMQKQLCEALGIQPSIAHWHVRRLETAQLVQCVRQGRAVNYYPGTSLLEVAATPALPQLPEIPAPLPLTGAPSPAL